ncbi:MAG: hypothetical protein AAGM22_15260 [Acidobacteriota bacterium]
MTLDRPTESISSDQASAIVVASAATTPTPDNQSPIKEFTASAIALVVVGVSLLVFFWFFRETSDPSQKEHLVDAGLALVGTVMGYYFGRVPAERRAEKAEEAADAAQKGRDQAQTESARTRQQAEDAVRKLDDVRSTLGRTERSLELEADRGAPSDRAAGHFEAVIELRALRQRIN